LLLVTAAILLLLTLLEVLWPGRALIPLPRRLKGAAFWVVYTLVGVTITTLLYMAWAPLGVRPLIRVHLQQALGWSGPLAPWIAALTLILVTDFFGYWFHRLQHGPLWRFHKVHHSIGEVTAVNSYGHVADEAFRFFTMTIPLSLIDLGPTATPLAIVIFMKVQAFFLHTDTRVHYGPFGWLFSDNRYHRIHHSLEARHFDRNFGTITTVWDRVFGTAYFPAKGEWPATGLADELEPAGLWDFIAAPFRSRGRTAGAAAAEGGAAVR
jgi:sterol desaturase/sphingolipid hydroxylase (fatty acid hydroxylase superfamily)